MTLNTTQQDYLDALLLFEKEKDGSASQDLCRRRLEDLRKVLGMNLDETLDLESQNISFDLTVLSTLALFSGKARLADIVGLFAPQLEPTVTLAVNRLIEKGLMTQDSDCHLSLQNPRVIFNTSQNGYSHLKFVNEMVLNASAQMPSWYHKRTESIFASSIISMNKKEFMAIIESLRTGVVQMQSQIESHNPDELLSFNLQIYPLEIKKSSKVI